MSKMQLRIIEKKKDKALIVAINKLGSDITAAINITIITCGSNDLKIIEQKIMEWLPEKLYKDIKDNFTVKEKGFNFKTAELLSTFYDVSSRFPPQSQNTYIMKAYEQVQLRLLTEKEETLMNEDLVEIMNNKKTAPKEPKTLKGLRV